MVLGWIAAGMGEAAKQFRRVNGYLHLPALRGRPGHDRHCPTEQGGCRRLISTGTATKLPRRSGHPPVGDDLGERRLAQRFPVFC